MVITLYLEDCNFRTKGIYVTQTFSMASSRTTSDFSSILFSRVEAYLSDPTIILKCEITHLLKALIILVFYFWSYYQWILSSDSFWEMIGFATLLGIGHVLIPVNISHDAMHSAFSKYPILNYLAYMVMGLTGISPYMYKRIHLKAHSDKENGSRRKSIESQKLLMQHSNRKNVPIVFYLLYAIYMVYIRDFFLFVNSEIKIPVSNWVLLALNKFIYFIAIWIVSFWLIELPAWQILIGILCIYLVVSLLAIVILLMPTEPMEVARITDNQQRNNAWVREIIKHNVDFSPESKFLNFICGGANMNVVHYLFPGVSHMYYTGIAKILKETAAEFEVVYQTQSVWNVFAIHFRYMLELDRN